MPENISSQFNRVFAFPIETFRSVSTISERDSIPGGVRWEGMHVYVSQAGEQKTYELRGGLTNDFWEPISDINLDVAVDAAFSTTSTNPLRNSTITNGMYQRTQLQTSGQAQVHWDNLTNVPDLVEQSELDDYQLRSEKGQANGYPSLDGNGQVPVSQLPTELVRLLGDWNADTNTPTLVNGTGTQGDAYKVSVAGTTDFGDGPITFAVDDLVVYDGSVWEKITGGFAYQNLTFSNGDLSISNGNTVDLDSRYTPTSQLPGPQTLSFTDEASELTISDGNTIRPTSLAYTTINGNREITDNVSGWFKPFTWGTGNTGWDDDFGYGIEVMRKSTSTSYGGFQIIQRNVGNEQPLKYKQKISGDLTSWTPERRIWSDFNLPDPAQKNEVVSLDYNANNAILNSYEGDLDNALSNNNSSFWFQSSATNIPPFISAGGMLLNRGVGVSNTSVQIIQGWGGDELGYRGKLAGVQGPWYQVASREWVSTQGFLTSTPTLKEVTTAGNTTDVNVSLTGNIDVGSSGVTNFTVYGSSTMNEGLTVIGETIVEDATNTNNPLTGGNAGFGLSWNDTDNVLDWGEYNSAQNVHYFNFDYVGTSGGFALGDIFTTSDGRIAITKDEPSGASTLEIRSFSVNNSETFITGSTTNTASNIHIISQFQSSAHGINIFNPVAPNGESVEITGGNLSVDTAGSGIILSTPDGTSRSIVTLNAAGTDLVVTPL